MIKITNLCVIIKILCILVILLPFTLTNLSPKQCCNGDNIINSNDSCIYPNSTSDDYYCTDSDENNATRCEINLLCGDNNTYDTDWLRYFYEEQIKNFPTDIDGNLIISRIHFFFYDTELYIPYDE